MKYKIKTFFGCTSNCIEVNDKAYTCEDPRYGLTDEERNKFDNDLIEQVKKMFDAGEISITSLIELLDVENIEYSETCDTCGDSVTTTTYEEFELD